MRALRVVLMSMAIIGFFFACKRTEIEKVNAPAEKEFKEEAPSYAVMGDVRKGRALFRDLNFGNGKARKSCDSCHPDGKGLNKAGGKSKFNIMNQRQDSLEEAVNFCIERALKGQVIDPDGQDMKDIVAYIRSLRK